MGSVDQPFGRNVEFEATFPELSEDEIVRNRHGDRLGLLKPDPQVISRKLFTRAQSAPANCHCGRRIFAKLQRTQAATIKQPSHVNVLAAFWIQFMTHDWFSHLEEGSNRARTDFHGMQRRIGRDLTALGCRPEDRIDKALVAEDGPAPSFVLGDQAPLVARAHKTTPNKVTAWWDASQIYGYDDISRRRVQRDPQRSGKIVDRGESSCGRWDDGYLPVLQTPDPNNPQWSGQETVAFPDNWNIGLSFFHNVFAREHNRFVEEFRENRGRSARRLRPAQSRGA